MKTPHKHAEMIREWDNLIDNIMALADEYTCLCTFMQDGTAAESAKRARQALRAALTEALAQPIDTSPEGVEKSGGNVQVQPVALNWRELVAWWESGAEQWDGLRDIVKKMIQARSAQQGWQPIETAPIETEVFIGRFIDGKFKFGRSEMFYEQANEFAGETFSGWVWSEDECSSSITESPTHWMSLPTPPTTI